MVPRPADVLRGIGPVCIFRQTRIAELDPATTDHSPKPTLSRGLSTVKPGSLTTRRNVQRHETVLARHAASLCVNSTGVIACAA
jgi:hypothetical protein